MKGTVVVDQPATENARPRSALEVTSSGAFVTFVSPDQRRATSANTDQSASGLTVAGDDPVNNSDPTGMDVHATAACEYSIVLAVADSLPPSEYIGPTDSFLGDDGLSFLHLSYNGIEGDQEEYTATFGNTGGWINMYWIEFRYTIFDTNGPTSYRMGDHLVDFDPDWTVEIHFKASNRVLFAVNWTGHGVGIIGIIPAPLETSPGKVLTAANGFLYGPAPRY